MKIRKVLLPLFLLASFYGYNQTLGHPVQKYQKVEVLNDSVKVYYSSITQVEINHGVRQDITREEYYVEVNDTCIQVKIQYPDDRVRDYIYAFGKTGFTKYTDSKYYIDNKAAEVNYDGGKTSVLFTIFDRPVKELLDD